VEAAVLLPRYRSVAIDQTQRAGDFPIGCGNHLPGNALPHPSRRKRIILPTARRSTIAMAFNGNAAGDFLTMPSALQCWRAPPRMMRGIFRPQILHCHDWQSGLAPVYLRTDFARDPTFIGVRTLFTIHNLGYQGNLCARCPCQGWPRPQRISSDGIEFYGDISFMKGGLNYSDALSTVSRGYALEIQTPEYGFGLPASCARARTSFTAFEWRRLQPVGSANRSPHLSALWAGGLSGKRTCKLDLIRTFGFDEGAIGRPLLGVVSRLAAQKGTDLIVQIADALAGRGPYLVLLGTGEADLETALIKTRRASGTHPGPHRIR